MKYAKDKNKMSKSNKIENENWNNVYSDITLPSGDMGTIKVERVDDERESKGV